MFRIFTEDKNAAKIKRALETLGLDYTIYRARGSWHNHPEKSIVVELDNVPREIAEMAALIIKNSNRQESILLQEIKAETTFL